MNNYSSLIQTAAQYLSQKLDQPLDCAIILGSGLSDIAKEVTVRHTIDFQDIPGMQTATAPSHQGKLLFCEIADKHVALCVGRLHLYEGYTAQQVAMLTYTLNAIGVKQLIVSNAAGALNTAFHPGDIMVIDDQINFTSQNPITGQDDTLGVRFSDMSQAYDSAIRAKAFSLANTLGLAVHMGVYAGVSGPCLETSAERRMLRQWGADAVGMSTVLEVIAANHCGMQVLGLSAITNLALGNADQRADTIESVLENAAIAGEGIKKIIYGLLLT